MNHLLPVRRVALALLATVTVAGLSACGSEDASDTTATAGTTKAAASAPDLSKVTLTIGQGSAQAETLFKAAGADQNLPYKIKWVTFDSGPIVAQSLKSGAVDFGFSVSPAQLTANDTIKIVLGGTGWEKATALVARKGSGINTIADIKGKKVGVIEGATDYLTYQLAAQAGVKKGDFTLVKLSTTTGLAAFKSGRIDAWTIWYPLVSQAVKAGGTLIEDGSSVPETGANFVSANDKALADPGKRAAFADFVQRYTKAQNWANANHEKWAPAYAKLWGLSVPDAVDALKYLDLHYAPIDATLIAGQQKLYDFQVAQGGKSKALDIKPYFDTTFNADVATS